MVEHGSGRESDSRESIFVMPGISGRHFIDLVRRAWALSVGEEYDPIKAAQAVAQLAAVLASNPRVLDQSSVRHNLGQRKVDWCEDIIQGTMISPRRIGRQPTAMEMLDALDEEGRD